MEVDPLSPQRASAALERGLLVVLLVLIAALGALWWGRGGGWRGDGLPPADGPEPPYAGRIDPNAADWPSLACLPGIGETKAKAILEYRRAHAGRSPVFRTPGDLARVSGIGPAIVQRVTPFLVFPATDNVNLDAAPAPTTKPDPDPSTAPDSR